MLVIAVLNGWSSSSRGKQTRTSTLVERLTKGQSRIMLRRRAMLFHSRARLFQRFIFQNQSLKSRLLVVGKSLGARNLVTHVLNELPSPLVYRRTALVTIDPCWPAKGRLRPNLNETILKLEHRVDLAMNYVAIRSNREQAGALLDGHNVFNDLLPQYDHYSIVQAPEVELGLKAVIAFLGNSSGTVVSL